ncbi:MAG: OmpH family outer membrane protein [Steroidobacteraceae bacterium]
MAGMTGRSRAVIIAGALALCAVCAPAWADLKIGFVNYALLMQQSPQAKAVQQNLRNEFAPKQRELASAQQALKTKEAQLQRDAATMSADQRASAQQALTDGQRELSEKVTDFNDEVNARQNQEMSRLQKTLVEQVQRYAQAQRFDLVLADGVIWANPTIDITQPVLAALQASGASSAAAPKSGAAKSGAAKPRR